MNIIGLVGFKGSGKDTAAKLIQEMYGHTIDSFAAPLKDTLSIVFGWERSLLEGATTESRQWRETPDLWWEEKLDWNNHKYAMFGRFTPRLAMQLFGTNIFREMFDDSIWVNSLEKRIASKPKIVITDCRFPNECDVIRNNGGILINIMMDKPKWYDIGVKASSGDSEAIMELMRDYPEAHMSEWAWLSQSFDYTIDNTGNLANLCNQLEKIIGKK